MLDSHPVLWLIHSVVSLLLLVVVVGVILSWLVAFDVINLRNRFVRMIYDTTNAIMNPLLRPIRRFIPTIGGLDLSPLILFLALGFFQRVVDWVWYNLRIPF